MEFIGIALMIIGLFLAFGIPFTFIGRDYPYETIGLGLFGLLFFTFGMLFWKGGY